MVYGVNNGDMIIVGNDCEECRYCTILEESKGRVKVSCGYRDGKQFYWGQCIPCEYREVKKL